MPTQTILRTVTFKLYPTAAQTVIFTDWLNRACWLYNRCLEQRIKAYARRSESVSFNDQCALLVDLRERISSIAALPSDFARSALRRVDRGFKAFFRRCKEGAKKKGFPRFRSRHRYHSLEYLKSGSYVRDDSRLHVPVLGTVRMRAGDQDFTGTQKVLRIIRRASGWYGQVVLDTGIVPPEPMPITNAIGMDVGLTHFAALSNGEMIDNPRCLRRSERKLKRTQRLVSRRQKGSRNRRKAIRKLQRVHERIAAQRRDFAHQASRRIVNAFDLIAFEKLNIKGLAGGMLAKSVHDAAWALFLCYIVTKAENAGKTTVAVDARGTSQECPFCGAIVAKSLSERHHRCPCTPVVIDRDYASGLVIETRALGVAGVLHLKREAPLFLAPSPGVSAPDESGSPPSTRREDTTQNCANYSAARFSISHQNQ